MASASTGYPEHHRKSLSLLFYRAVRDLKPVWMLEEMRTMETFYRGENSSLRTYTPSEALLYAIVHDHQAYARYLLSQFTEEALAEPGDRFCCCASPAPHLSMAVRYDRRHILGLILHEAHRVTSTPPYADRAGCSQEGRTPLHLACELQRPEAVLVLLVRGASPLAEDTRGLTPLDVLLEKLADSGVQGGGTEERRQCLENLLVFMPRVGFKMQAQLSREPERWVEVLGEETVRFLAGRRPPSLFLVAMRTILAQLSPESFPENLQNLPIPSCLKPPGLPEQTN